jgi:hypothetical protein
MPARKGVARIVATAVAALVLVTACGSSSGTSPAAPAASPTPTPTAVPTPTLPPGAVTPAPSTEATAPAGSPGTQASAPPATSKPLPTMGPAELALVDRLPTQILDVQLDREAHDLASLNDAGVGWKQFVEFSTQLGLDPAKVLVGYSFLHDGKAFKEKYGKASFLYGAFEFTGADPATLPEAFLKVSAATQPGSSAAKETIAGREVYVLDPGSGMPDATKSYAVFVGDTVFFGGSDDPALRDAIVSSLPQ